MNNPIDELPPPPAPPSREISAFEEAADPSRDAQPDATFNAPQRLCSNCGAPVHGPYCYACGQSETGMVRNLTEVFRDLGDILFNVDSRIFRSLFDLFFRPGFLTTEYIDGRRARYVTPFRLFFVLCVVAFFAMHSIIDGNAIDRVVKFNIDEAQTAEEVNARVATNIAALSVGSDIANLPDEAKANIRSAEADFRAEGERRLRKLEKRAADKAKDAAGNTFDTEPKPERGFNMDGGVPRLDGVPISSVTHPIIVAWLPDAANRKFNATFDHMLENVKNIQENPSRALEGLMSVLPQTLFVLMPLFAVMLKFFYIFKRRLYMEHLLVALHSHAFIFLALIVIIVLSAAQGWADRLPWLADPLGWLQALVWIWLFVYLFVMQKRVYRQGWIMTTIKFSVIGYCYSVLLTFGMVAAAFVSLAVT